MRLLGPLSLAIDGRELRQRPRRAGVLAGAATLYRGELLQNRGPVASRFDDWLVVERSAATILRRFAATQQRPGRSNRIAAAMSLVTIDILREDSHRLLLLELLAGAGRRAEALRRSDAVAQPELRAWRPAK